MFLIMMHAGVLLAHFIAVSGDQKLYEKRCQNGYCSHQQGEDANQAPG
jgi:hypothetical protein